jgi:chaperonin GroES
MSSIRPLGDRVLVEPHKEEEITSFGIVLPDSATKEKKAQGVIIAIGNGEEIKKLDLKVGNVVVFKKGWDNDVKIGKGAEEKEYKILDHEEVMAVIE